MSVIVVKKEIDRVELTDQFCSLHHMVVMLAALHDTNMNFSPEESANARLTIASQVLEKSREILAMLC